MSKKVIIWMEKMISIYKTNIENSSQIQLLKKELDTLLGEENWNFDLDDCDRILRVETDSSLSNEITYILKSNGFEVTELY